MVVLGDSIGALGLWFGFGNIAGGYRTSLLANLSVGGYKTADIIANTLAPAITAAPEWVIVEGGGNDVTNDVSSETTIANLATIYSTLRAAGIGVIASTVLPSVFMNTAPRQAAVVAVNAWIRANASQYDLLCDWNGAMSDGVEWDPHDAYFSDGVHPNPTGEAIMGAVLGPVFAQVT
jgi:lysophospholipase L1-like esterase